jgi:clathrin heavy chain
LNDHQIINYHADASLKWLCLIGIAPVQGRVVGNMQLYSVERRVSQPIEGHAAAFAQYQIPGAPKPTTLFTFATRNAAQSKLFVTEVGKGEADSGPKFQRRATDIFFPAEAAADFPVAMEVSARYQVVYLITKMGYLHIFDLATGTLIFMNKVSEDRDTIFTTVPIDATGGLIGINRKGQVLSISLNDATIIPYITSKGDLELAIKMAARANLPGAEDLFSRQFQTFFSQQRYQDAARVAAESPNQFLRTQNTIRLFQSVPQLPGQPPAVLQYFSVLLEKGNLNRMETLELARPVIAQGRKDLIEKWIQEGKLDWSEELGDAVRALDPKLALQVFLKAGAKEKIVLLLAESGQFAQLVQWCAQERYSPDWLRIVAALLASNPQGAVNLAKLLLTAEGGPLADRAALIEVFISRNMLQETTAVLLDVLAGNKPEDGPLQTRLLEMNLRQAPQVADVILGNDMFSHYDRPLVAKLAEQAGLLHRALEHFTDLNDWKRVLRNAFMIKPELLVPWFGRIAVADRFECLKEMLTANIRQNLANAVQVCIRFHEELGAVTVIKMFGSFKSTEGIFFFLQPIVDLSTDPEVHFKYIEACAKLNNPKEVERIVRSSTHYEPERVRDFLKEAKLNDQLPLVLVCDKYNFIEDLTNYLYKGNMLKYVEAYITQVNPRNTPKVVGALLDNGAGEDLLTRLIAAGGNHCPTDELVEEIEKRNRLKILQPWLEQRFRDGLQEPALHNALAKIAVDDRKDAEKFLLTNQFYDSRVVGKYCENRDPYLAFVAYKRGLCDKELVDVTNKQSLFKHQARYLVERQKPELWAYVLSEANLQYRRQLIDQVVQTALPESKNPEEVSLAVQAFMQANLPNELIELLEKIILDNVNSNFSKNKNLQNLLLLTAIRAHSDDHKDRVMGFIKRLDQYDAGEIANVAIEARLFEEALAIFQKAKMNKEAVAVLLNHLSDLERAADFAERSNQPEVYSQLARAQLRAGHVKDAINSYIKAQDPSDYLEVIATANQHGETLADDFVKYLQMCRRSVREQRIDSELIYALAKTSRLAELEDFVASPNVANLQDVSDRCFNEGLYEAAQTLYTGINNFPKLAITLLRLQQYQQAVEAARKANNSATWKEVSKACVEAKQFRLAQVAGLAIIIHGDEMEELIQFYEQRGFFEELLQLMESGLGLERAHVGMFTELAILYSKYNPKKLMEHIKLFHARLSIPRVCHWCEKNHQWKELTFLHVHYDEFDKAVQIMIQNSSDAWDHVLFKETIVKCVNVENYYRAVRFYLEEHPGLATDFLQSLVQKVDHSRVVSVVRDLGHLPLIKPYLIAVQNNNLTAVNDALNQLYIEEEDFASLRASIDAYDQFDAIALARRCEKHDLLEFRRIAAYLYKKNGRYAQSMELSKKDKLYHDSMKTAADSDDPEVAEQLLSYFATELQDKEAFAACLFVCYHLVRPDVALELAWRNKMVDQAFPFIIQFVREYTEKVNALVAAEEKRQQAMQAAQAAAPAMMADPAMTNAAMMATGVPPHVMATTMVHPSVMMSMAPPMGNPMMPGVMGPMSGVPMGAPMGAFFPPQ